MKEPGAIRCRDFGKETSAQRAEWLANIAAALDEATSAVVMLDALASRTEILQLYAEIEALKLEVASLRLGGVFRAARDFHPERISSWLEPMSEPACFPHP